MRITVPVSRLLPGDLLLGSDRVVVDVRRDPYNGRKSVVTIHPANNPNDVYSRVWGTSTTITVERSDGAR